MKLNTLVKTNIKKKISNKTKAILLVTPNNPTGVEYPKELILGFSLIFNCWNSNIFY